MKIAYICTDSGIPVFGNKGASIHIREIVSNLRRLENEIFIVATSKGEDTYPGFNFKIYQIRPFTSKKLGSDLRKILTNKKLFLQALRIFGREKPDAIYERYELYGLSGVLLAKLFNIPHLLEVNAPLLLGSRRQVKFYGLARLIERMAFRLSDGIILTTSYLKDYVLRIGIKDTSIHVIPDGVDVEKFKPKRNKDQQLMEKFKLQDSFVVGFVGTLVPRQGLETLIEAARNLRKAGSLSLKYLIIGEGRSENELKSLIEAYHLKQEFIFVGCIEHERIPDYINLMDICVLPDMSIYSSPVKIFEYMAMAKPVILPFKGQMKQFFTHLENCFFIEPGNEKELQEAILLLAQNKNLREKLGRKAREKVSRELTWIESARKILQIYQISRK